MSAQLLNKKLKLAGVQYKQSGQWILTAKYKDGGYATNRVHHYNKKRWHFWNGTDIGMDRKGETFNNTLKKINKSYESCNFKENHF